MGGLYDILESYRNRQNRLNYEGLYQDPDRFLDFDNSRVDFSNQADYPFTGNIPTNRRARYDARAYNRNEPLPSPYGIQGGTFFKNFDPRVGFPNTPVFGITPENFSTTEEEKDEDQNLIGLFDEGLTTAMPSFGSTQKAPTAFGTKRRGGGISDLFRALVGFAVPGANLLMGGLDGIRSLNQRLQGSTFGRSRSMQEFLERKRNEKLGNVGPGGIGLSRSELVQRNFANRVRDLADAGDDDRGGGASRTQRDAGPGFDDVSEAGSF